MQAGKSVPAQVRVCILQFASAGKRVGSSINPGLGKLLSLKRGIMEGKDSPSPEGAGGDCLHCKPID